MSETAVTHEQLRAGQMALIDRFGEHEKHFRETSAKLFDRVDRAIEASHDNRVHIVAIQSDLRGVVSGRADHLSRLDKIEGSVAELKAEGHRRAGREGVLAAIVRSPFFAYLVAGCVGIWAFVTNAAGMKP